MIYAACIGAGLCALLLYVFIARVVYIKIGGTDGLTGGPDYSEIYIAAFFWPIILPILAISIPIKFAWNLKKIPDRIPEAKAKYVDEAQTLP